MTKGKEFNSRQETLRHYSQLEDAIYKYGPTNGNKRKLELDAISRSDSGYLDYMNPFGEELWQKSIKYALEECGIDLYQCKKVTALHHPWHTNLKNPVLSIRTIKRHLYSGFCGIPFIGMIEFAVFTNVKQGSSCLLAPHFEGFFIEIPSGKAMKAARNKFDGGMFNSKGLWAEKVTDPAGALDYAIKLPAYGHRAIVSSRRKWVRNCSARMYLPTHYALFKNLRQFHFPELTVGGGLGAKVLRRALKHAKKRGYTGVK